MVFKNQVERDSTQSTKAPPLGIVLVTIFDMCSKSSGLHSSV